MANGGLEIERRYILRCKPAAEAAEAAEAQVIFQKYAADGWRYRQAEHNGTVRYYKTRKASVGSGINEEEEYEIDKHTFLNQCGEILKGIHKTRYVYEHDGLRFEVDKFHHLDLVIMEVELNDIDQPFTMPSFISSLVLYEITGIKAFSNSALALPEYLNLTPVK